MGCGAVSGRLEQGKLEQRRLEQGRLEHGVVVQPVGGENTGWLYNQQGLEHGDGDTVHGKQEHGMIAQYAVKGRP
jgi:hypothetical protein